MAFGFPPKYEQTTELNGLNPQYYLAVALKAAKSLNWNIGHLSHGGFIAYTGFSMRTYGEQFKIILEGDEVTIVSKSNGSALLDLGKNKRVVNQFQDAFDQIFDTLTAEEMQAVADELTAAIAEQTKTKSSGVQNTLHEKKSSFISLFIPREGYYVTPIIVNANILVFVLMILNGVSFFEPDTRSLILWGANLRVLTLDGQAWRLLTNIFLHIGIFHLLLNMYALIYIGLLLEPYLGKTRFAGAYLLTGIAASVTSIFWNQNTISAGASGAIFGMYGVFLAMLTTNFIEPSARKALLTSIGVFVAYNLVNGLKAGIDGAAHIGGLVSGLIIGYAYYPSLKKPDLLRLKYLTIGLIAILTFCSAAVVMRKIPNDFAVYDQKMKTFTYNEEAALEIIRTAQKTSHDKLLSDLKNKGIPYWQENVNIVQDADKLDVPAVLHKRDRLIIDYCRLRIKNYELIYKMVDENDQKYNKQISDYNAQIKSLLDSIKAN